MTATTTGNNSMTTQTEITYIWEALLQFPLVGRRGNHLEEFLFTIKWQHYNKSL